MAKERVFLSEAKPDWYNTVLKMPYAKRVETLKEEVRYLDVELVPAVKKYNAKLWERVRRDVYRTIISHSIQRTMCDQTFELCKAVFPDIAAHNGYDSYPHFVSDVVNVYYNRDFVMMARSILKGLSDAVLGCTCTMMYVLMTANGEASAVAEIFVTDAFLDIIGRPYQYC